MVSVVVFYSVGQGFKPCVNLIPTEKKIGLEITKTKTKYMCMKRQPRAEAKHLEIKLDERQWTFQSVKQFLYLGVVLTSNNEGKAEIRAEKLLK